MSLPYYDEDDHLMYPENFRYPKVDAIKWDLPNVYDVNEWFTWAIKYNKMYCDVGGVRRLGYCTKLNDKTVWMKIMKGARTSFTIKRHIVKHNVRRYIEQD
jgi:hypothetical protein